MKARAIKDLRNSWYLKNSFKMQSPKGLSNFERIFKYQLLSPAAFTLLPILVIQHCFVEYK